MIRGNVARWQYEPGPGLELEQCSLAHTRVFSNTMCVHDALAFLQILRVFCPLSCLVVLVVVVVLLFVKTHSVTPAADRVCCLRVYSSATAAPRTVIQCQIRCRVQVGCGTQPVLAR